MTFAFSDDLDLVRSILSDRRCYCRIASDETPSIDEIHPQIAEGLYYVVGHEDDRPVALFVLLSSSEGMEVHFTFLPQTWGHTTHIASLFMAWLWNETHLDRVIGPVPSHNRLALALAQRVGFRQYDTKPQAGTKNGMPYDLLLLEAVRP